MKKARKTSQEIVYRQGSNWVWSRYSDQRRAAIISQLPYYITTPAQVREYIRARCDYPVRITWAR